MPRMSHHIGKDLWVYKDHTTGYGGNKSSAGNAKSKK